jgi:TPR repeat protein
VNWYRKAAGQGNANAAFNLGVAYSNGIGIQQNMDQAAQWFLRAAGSGIVNAQFNLGLLYERGDGVPVSQVEAYAWYSAAANHGDTGAGQRRDRLASTLSPSTLKEAQARAQQVLTTIQNGANNAPAGGITSATPAAARR